MRISLTFLVFLLTSVTILSQNIWTDVSKDEIRSLQNIQPQPLPSEYRVVDLDFTRLKTVLLNAPMEFTDEAKNNPLVITLPTPGGKMHHFEVAVSPIMEQGLADKFPEIKTFILQGVEDRSATGRMDINASQFHAFILGTNGTFLIDPAGDHYISFFKKNKHIPKDYRPVCGHDHSTDNDNSLQASTRNVTNHGDELRTYRIAVSATGEYSIYHGGTVSSVISAITTTLNRVNTVFERDAAVRLLLVNNNDLLVFLDTASDPFDNSSSGQMLGINTNTINGIIGEANYDIGHVFATGGAGLAGLGVVCSAGKGRGSTGVFPPIGDFFDVDYVSHEIGHQFSGNHTFNNCGGNENPGTGFEPGSGATIMAYAGLCNSNNLQFSTDDYFHGITLREMSNFINNGGIDCAVAIPSNNTPPTVEIREGGFHIPISTPFELIADASDADGDMLTYTWEQFDGGNPVPLGMPSGNAPHFRSYPPTTASNRVFPRIGRVISNDLYTSEEYLTDYERGMTFAVSVRDNNAGAGGLAFAELEFDVTESAGPFLVTHPNDPTVEWEVGQWVEVNWDVANTDNSIVNCQLVDIKLSVDGGFTYPYTLTEKIANTGSGFISVPNVLTNLARVRVQAADNIFFDISNFNFSIVPPSQPGFSYYLTPNFQEFCLPDNATIDVITDSLLGYNEMITYNITSPLPAGVNSVFSANPAPPSDGSILTLDMSNYNISDTFDITIQAIANGLDTAYRTVTIRTVGNDFSSLAMDSPVDGASGVEEIPQFNWYSAQPAEQYFIQIAKSPTFEASTIHSEAITTDTFFTPSTQLEVSTPYYWRVRAANECGDQDFLATRSFHTLVFACEKYENNTSVTIPSNATTGTPFESKITIPAGGPISDLNVSKIKGNHSNMNHLDVSLISPQGTEVNLFSNICLIATIFDFGLDDEAPGDILCPAVNEKLYLPQDPLSTFDGEPVEGVWTLKTEVNNVAGNGGKIQNFHLTLCSDVSLNPPVLVTNDLLPVVPSQGRAITDEFLLVEDANNTPMELEYTLVTAPAHGQLFFLGNEVNVGDNFRQSSVNGGNVMYVHNGDNNQFDAFTFTVTDGEGGFIGTPQFDIEIDPDATVNVNNLLDENEIRIFPNPNNGDFHLVFKNPVWKNLTARMFNVHGQLILERNLDGAQSQFLIQTPNVTEGIYFLKIETEGESLVKKIIVN